MSSGPRLTLYSRRHCHLCHDMQAQLQAELADAPHELEVLDIDQVPALLFRYNELVPVLMHQDEELARHRLDEVAIARVRALVRSPH